MGQGVPLKSLQFGYEMVKSEAFRRFEASSVFSLMLCVISMYKRAVRAFLPRDAERGIASCHGKSPVCLSVCDVEILWDIG